MSFKSFVSYVFVNNCRSSGRFLKDLGVSFSSCSASRMTSSSCYKVWMPSNDMVSGRCSWPELLILPSLVMISATPIRNINENDYFAAILSQKSRISSTDATLLANSVIHHGIAYISINTWFCSSTCQIFGLWYASKSL